MVASSSISLRDEQPRKSAEDAKSRVSSIQLFSFFVLRLLRLFAEMLSESDARIAPGEEEVRDKIAGDEQASRHHHAGHHQLIILGKERLHGEPAQSRPR